MEHLVHAEVDLVVLNHAPATLVALILGTGEPLTIKDRAQYLHLLWTASEEADAFRRTADEYYKVFERSASLSAPDREALLRILTFLEGEIVDYGTFRTMTWQEYTDERNKMHKRAVERWVEQLVNALVDAAKTIVASEKKKMPYTYREIVETLGTIPPYSVDDLVVRLARWTSLRNILAHEYLDLRWKEIRAFLDETEPLWREFIARTKQFVEGSSGSVEA
jgi:uncharacterized protein YutE (UPF0331/DUF86 family)